MEHPPEERGGYDDELEQEAYEKAAEADDEGDEEPEDDE
jgi:hypothetical protein